MWWDGWTADRNGAVRGARPMVEDLVNNPALKSYRPGRWYAVVGTSVTVLLPAQEKDRVPGLWALIDQGSDFATVLDHLVAPGLSTLSGFALLSEESGRIQALCRGPVRARFTTPDGDVLVDGTGAITWSQAYLDGVSQSHLEIEGEELDQDSAALDLPIITGLVRVQEFSSPATSQEAIAPPAPVEPISVIEPAPVAPAAPAPASVAEASDEEPGEGAADEPVLAPVVPLSVVPAPPESAWDDAAADDPSLADPRTIDPFGESAADHLGGLDEDSVPFDPLSPEAEDDNLSTISFDQVAPGALAQNPFAPPAVPTDVPPAEAVAHVVLPSGESLAVDMALLFGRAPEARRFQTGEEPRLIAVPSPHQEISSTHVEIRPGVGDQTGAAVVTDLGSTNGTVIVQPGRGPEELQPGVAVTLIPGAIVDLGDGVTLQITAP